MNEREDYLDRLLRGVEEEPEDIQDIEDDFLEEFNNSISEDDENDFLQAFEKSRNKSRTDSGTDMELDTDMDMDFDMDDIDHIVSNVKNGTLDDLEEADAFEEVDTLEAVDTLGEGDLPIEESLQSFAEDSEIDGIDSDFGSDSQEFMINTMDESDDSGFESGESNPELTDMLSGMDGEDEMPDTSQPALDMPEDEMASMAAELVKEIEDLNLESGEDSEKKEKEKELDSVLAEEEEEPETGKKGKKKGKKGKDKGEKKQGFFKRLSAVLFGEEEEVIEEDGKAIPEIGEIENISDENMNILRELEESKSKPEEDEKAKKAQKKKERAEKKAQKKKERAEKKAQKKKEKAERPKKEKKVKEPKVVVKTKPLPKKPVFLIVLVGISLVILLNLLTNLIGYQTAVREAQKHYDNGDYVEAYTCFTQGEEVKAADEELYKKAKFTAYVQQQLRNYATYQEREMYTEALNALICGVGRYDKNASDAAKAGASAEYDKMIAELEKYLSENYKMSLEQARELYGIRERDEFTYALYDIIEELGLAKE